ncbi:alpha/beta hydrolase [Spongiivirga citrea]|uniref:Esterase n=1 Tax=Spongiivirga citrea TaxID=1481457 RepID=A0A6M0CR14_9FLAO|nr:alpha/beta hydrolase-fold protein [Spongiivirga citrea]NER18514.1 esterase [Spongiivirga citrea]
MKLISFITAFLSCVFFTKSIAQSNHKTLKTKQKGKVIMYKDFKSEIVQSRNVEVFLPAGYDQNDSTPYHVLYMHDGQNVFNPSTSYTKIDWGVDETIDSLMRIGAIEKTIVVAPWNTFKTRFIEYMPAQPKEATDNDQARKALMDNFGGEKLLSDEYLEFLVKELKPFIDKTYNVSTKAEDTFIMGSSMGGLISLYAISKYPDVFGAAGCVSTHWPIPMIGDAYIATLPSTLPDPKTHKIYFDYGTETLDAQYEPYQMRVDKIMTDKGYVKNENWITQKFEGADHSEKSWNARAHIPILFMLAK